jgi:hypothetical protein
VSSRNRLKGWKDGGERRLSVPTAESPSIIAMSKTPGGISEAFGFMSRAFWKVPGVF